MPRRAWVAMAVVALVATTAMTGHAARLNGITSKKLTAFALAGQDPLPLSLVTENFNYASATNLAGTTAETLQPWTVLGGTSSLQQKGNVLTCPSACASGGYAAGIVDADKAAVKASVSVRLGQSGQSGLVMNSDASFTSAIAILYGANTVQVVRYTPTSSTFSPTYPTGTLSGTSVVLSATYAAGAYTIRANGNLVTTYPLSAADQTLYGASTYFGVVMYGVTSASELNDFAVTK